MATRIPSPHPSGSALDDGVDALLRMQRPDGSWEGECVWCPMLAAQYVMTAQVIGLEIPTERCERLRTHFRVTRNAAGLWGLHPFASASLFVTTLVYVAARLLDVSPDEPWLRDARRWFDEEGGVQRIPTWGKVWLAVLGLYDWKGVDPILPELWLLPGRLPIHPANYYCHTRSIYMGLAALYAGRVVAGSTARLDQIRRELYPAGYAEIDFRTHASRVRTEDAPYQASRPLRFAYGLSRLYERLDLHAIRLRALERLRRRMRDDLEASDYMALSPVNGLLAIVALWFHDPGDPHVARAIDALEVWFWEDECEGARVAGAGSVCWDTSFALQALASLEHDGVTSPALAKGAQFLASQQIQEGSFDHRAAHRIEPTGGWCFSRVGHGWPVSDCTAEALVALLDAGAASIGQERTAAAVRFMLRCQNRDGGFGSYEPQRSFASLDWLNPSEMFGRCMTERSYIECTASCLIALRRAGERYPRMLRARIERAIARARRFLIRAQNADGSWSAAWGVHYIYGTMFGVRGLLAAGLDPSDHRIRAACRWLLGRQHADGGWGEHPDGIERGAYVDLSPGLSIQTAWALTTLLDARDPNDDAIARAANFLRRSQQRNGEWPDGQFVGVFFETALLNYRLYRQYFPIMALGRAQRRMSQSQPLERTDVSIPCPTPIRAHT